MPDLQKYHCYRLSAGELVTWTGPARGAADAAEKAAAHNACPGTWFVIPVLGSGTRAAVPVAEERTYVAGTCWEDPGRAPGSGTSAQVTSQQVADRMRGLS